MRTSLLPLLLIAALAGGTSTALRGEDAAPAPAAAPAAPAAAPGGDAAAPAAAPAPAAADAPAPAPAPSADTKGKNKGDKLTLDQLPDLVKATVAKEAPEATTFMKVAGKNGGEDIYRARYTDKDGHKMQISVGSDGVLIDKGQAKGKNKGN